MINPEPKSKAYRILLIEDSPIDQKIFLRMLDDIVDLNAEVDVVDCLEAAFLKVYFEEHKYDTVILDLSLPESRGFETFDTFYSKHPNIPCVVISGISDRALIKKILNHGAYEYLIKGTYDIDTLEHAIYIAVNKLKSSKRSYF